MFAVAREGEGAPKGDGEGAAAAGGGAPNGLAGRSTPPPLAPPLAVDEAPKPKLKVDDDGG